MAILTRIDTICVWSCGTTCDIDDLQKFNHMSDDYMVMVFETDISVTSKNPSYVYPRNPGYREPKLTF